MNDSPGDLVFWSFGQPKISRSVFNTLSNQVNLPLIPKLKPSKAMSATIAQARKKLKNRFWHISQIRVVDTVRYYGLYEYKRTEAWDELEINQVATVSFDFKTGELRCDWPHPSFTRLKNIYNYFCSMVSYSDMIDWAAHILQSVYAVCIRERGGLYFVPRSQEDRIKAFAFVVNNVPGECWATCIPQMPSDALDATIIKFLAPSVEKSLEWFRSWVKPGIKTVLIDDIDARLVKLARFRSKLLEYQKLVGFRCKDHLTEVESLITKYLMQRDKAMQLVFTPRQQAYYNNKRYKDAKERTKV